MKLRPWFSRVGLFAVTAKDCALVALMPAFPPFILFHIAVRVLPLWGQAVVCVVLFAILVAAITYVSSHRMEAFIRAHCASRTRVWFPLAASIGFLVYAMHVFASIQSILNAVGLSALSPPVPQTEWTRITNLYLWHFASSIPGFKVPDTLKWSVPYQYTDRLTGFLILSFQVAVIAPVIKVFYTWSKIRKELRDAAPKPNLLAVLRRRRGDRRRFGGKSIKESQKCTSARGAEMSIAKSRGRG